MAAVLFVVTIPTADEEMRLKNEFFARKLNQMENGITITTTTIEADDKHATQSEQEIEDIEAANALTLEMPTTPVNFPNIQYGTFPMRNKSEQLFLIEALDKSQTAGVGPPGGGGGVGMADKGSASTSVKDVDVEATEAPPVMRKSWEGLRDILSSSKRKSQKKKVNCIDLNIPCDTCMEAVLRAILTKFEVRNAVWTKNTAGIMLQIVFTIEFNETYEKVLDKFHEWGIGDREGSTVSVINCLVSKTFARKDDFDLQDEYNRENINAQKQGAWDRFMNSVRSRLNVAQIVRDVRQNAAITFDFLILLISAAILASFGLVEDSTIFLASSMLISPLMGPIIAAIFGTVIKDRTLRVLGWKNELLGILVATLVGFLFGMIVCSFDERYGIGEGLTSEMLSRCELHSLLVGVFTAIPSGAAAAISILGGNIGSLVGVAISASLLPPAVNSGLLWALACIYKFFETDELRYPNVVKTNFYSNNQATELAILGTISMCLTIINVLCVYIMGVLVLKVKEIAPVISRNNRQFWKHDIKIARDLNKNKFVNSDTAIIDEFANLPKEDQKALGINCDFLRNMQDDAVYQNTWSPIATRHLYEQSYEPMRDNYSTVHRIERLYSTITNQQHTLKDRGQRRYSLARRSVECTSVFESSYKILEDDLPRCASMPSKTSRHSIDTITPDVTASSTASASNRTSGTDTPTMADERKRRKFIVTPAEDPLLYNTADGEMDV